jgi:hypothetical protein
VRLGFFFLDPHLTTHGTLMKKLVLHRGLLKKGTTTVFLQDPRTLILFLEAAQCAVDRFVLLNYNAYHCIEFPSVLNSVKRVRSEP